MQPTGENVLIQASDGNFYGTTSAGGAAGKGALFEMTPAGQETILHSFGDGSVPNDGVYPVCGVVQGSDGNFYGVTDDDASYVIEMVNISGVTPNSPVIGATETFPQPYAPVPGRDPGTFFKLVPTLPMLTSPLSVTGAVGELFNYQILATQTPTSYAASGLPPGLSIDSTSGIISGTPTAHGTSDVTLTITNAAGASASTLVISIVSPPTITSILTAFGTTSSAFGYQITGSDEPTSFSATGLPNGLSLNATTGIIYGKATAAGTYPITLFATNVAGTGSATLTLTISSSATSLPGEYVLIHSFNGGSVTGEGVYPGPLTPTSGSTFFGMMAPGGSASSESVFNLSASGSVAAVAGLAGASDSTCNGLIKGADGDFYGTTSDGGSTQHGTVFKVAPDGTVTVLHTFGGSNVTNDGANPHAGSFKAMTAIFTAPHSTAARPISVPSSR